MAASPFSIPLLPNAVTVPKPVTSGFNPSSTNLFPGGSTSKPFVIAGLKAAQPGGLGTTQTNTITPKQTAKQPDQMALGNSTNSGSTLPANSTTSVNPNAGQFGTGGVGPAGTTPAPAPTPVATATPATPPPTDTTPEGLLAHLAQYGATDPGLTDLYNQQQQLESDFADKTGNILNTPSDLNYQTGRLASLQSEYSSAKAALAQNYQEVLNQRAQGIGATESALGTATTLTPSPYGTPLINPATGQAFSGGAPLDASGTAGNAALNPLNNIDSIVNQVLSGQISPSQAYAMGGNVQNFQGVLNAAILAKNPQANLAQLEGQYAAKQQNVTTAGTAATGAASQAYNTAVQNVSKVTQQYTAATGVASNLTSTLANWSQSGLLTNLNEAINKVAGLTSSPQYAQFVAAITNTQAAYTAAFQTAGITPTQSTVNALQELNPNSSASAIIASLNQLSSDLHAATVVPAYQQQQTYGSQLGIQ